MAGRFFKVGDSAFAPVAWSDHGWFSFPGRKRSAGDVSFADDTGARIKLTYVDKAAVSHSLWKGDISGVTQDYSSVRIISPIRQEMKTQGGTGVTVANAVSSEIVSNVRRVNRKYVAHEVGTLLPGLLGFFTQAVTRIEWTETTISILADRCDEGRKWRLDDGIELRVGSSVAVRNVLVAPEGHAAIDEASYVSVVSGRPSDMRKLVRLLDDFLCLVRLLSAEPIYSPAVTVVSEDKNGREMTGKLFRMTAKRARSNHDFSPLPFIDAIASHSQLVTEWFKLVPNIRSPLMLLEAAMFKTGTIEEQFQYSIQSVEALWRVKHQSVGARRIKLIEKVVEMFHSVPEMHRQQWKISDRFIQWIVSCRNRLAHGSFDFVSPNADDYLNMTLGNELLTVIAFAAIMSMLGFAPETIRDAVGGHPSASAIRHNLPAMQV